jgi:hypothetical protein
MIRFGSFKYGLILASVLLAFGTRGRAATKLKFRPFNYNEAKIPAYRTPDPLVMQDEQPVTTARMWYTKRRPQIMTIRGTLDTLQGSGTFIANKKIEYTRAERERQLGQLVGESVSRAGSAGFTVEQLVNTLRELSSESESRRR